MSHWHDAGFGTDPEGDAARRAELEPARIDRLPNPVDDPVGFAAAVYDVPRELVESEVLPAAIGPHAVARIEHEWGVAWTCACGRWEAVATGPSSAAWAGADHRRHVRDEEAGTRGD